MSTTPFCLTPEVLSPAWTSATLRARACKRVHFCWQTRSGRISSAGAQRAVQPPSSAFPAPKRLQAVRPGAPPARVAAAAPGCLTPSMALDLQDRYGLGYWDALIVSSAHQQGCRYLLTEACCTTRVLDAVRAINPFVLPPPQTNWTLPNDHRRTPADTLANALNRIRPDVRAMHRTWCSRPPACRRWTRWRTRFLCRGAADGVGPAPGALRSTATPVPGRTICGPL